MNIKPLSGPAVSSGASLPAHGTPISLELVWREPGLFGSKQRALELTLPSVERPKSGNFSHRAGFWSSGGKSYTIAQSDGERRAAQALSDALQASKLLEVPPMTQQFPLGTGEIRISVGRFNPTFMEDPWNKAPHQSKGDTLEWIGQLNQLPAPMKAVLDAAKSYVEATKPDQKRWL